MLISELNSVACPVKYMKKYFNVCNILTPSREFLFKPMYRSGKTSGLIKSDKRLNYTRARECVVNRLREIMPPDCKIGLHSLRAGGATAAANFDKVNERCWKRHGRWKIETAKDSYIADSVAKRLKVSQNLGL